MKTGKKILSIVGIILGIVVIYLGFSVKDADYGSWQTMSVSFGADFYTYSYEAAAQAANNVLALAKIARSGIAYLLMAVGAFEALYFGCVLFGAPVREKEAVPSGAEPAENGGAVEPEETEKRGAE